MISSRLWLALGVLLLVAVPSLAMIEDFTGLSKNSQLPELKQSYWWTYMYSLGDSPAGSNEPHVSLDLLVTRQDSAKAGPRDHAAAIIFEESAGDLLGRVVNGSREYCCTQAIKAGGQCGNSSLNEILRFPDPRMHYFPFEFNAKIKAVKVLETGRYFLFLVNCGGEGIGSLTLNGQAEWVNPYGYLPGDVYYLLPFMGVLSLAYLAVLLYYAFLMIRHRKILLKIQWGIFGVICAGLIEVASWYFYRVGINGTGKYSMAALVVVVFINAVKKTVSRVLVLLVSMGVGTVKWTIGTTRVKLGLLALFYLFFAFLFQLVSELDAVEKTEVVSTFVSMLIIVPAAILDAFFYYWIILSLIRTIQQLTLRRQTLKLDMYKKFFAVIASAALLSVLMVLYQTYLKVFTNGVSWQNEWIFDAFWEALFVGILAAIAFLWRPRSNNTRYSYAEFFAESEAPADDDDQQVPLETLTVLGGGEVTRKVRNIESDEFGEKEAKPKPKPAPRPQNPQLTAFEKDIMSFDLPSDDDEDGGVSVETQLKKMD